MCVYCGHNTNKQQEKMSNFITLEEGTSYTNHEGETLTIKSITSRFCHQAMEDTINGAYTSYGWMSIEAIWNFANN